MAADDKSPGTVIRPAVQVGGRFNFHRQFFSSHHYPEISPAYARCDPAYSRFGNPSCATYIPASNIADLTCALATGPGSRCRLGPGYVQFAPVIAGLCNAGTHLAQRNAHTLHRPFSSGIYCQLGSRKSPGRSSGVNNRIDAPSYLGPEPLTDASIRAKMPQLPRIFGAFTSAHPWPDRFCGCQTVLAGQQAVSISVTPSAIAPNIRERREPDLSPGTGFPAS